MLFIFCLSIFTTDASFENELIVQALRTNTLSKLTYADSHRFDALIHDLFPDTPFKAIGYEKLAEAAKEAMASMKLVFSENQVTISANIYFTCTLIF